MIEEINARMHQVTDEVWERTKPKFEAIAEDLGKFFKEQKMLKSFNIDIERPGMLVTVKLNVIDMPILHIFIPGESSPRQEDREREFALLSVVPPSVTDVLYAKLTSQRPSLDAGLLEYWRETDDPVVFYKEKLADALTEVEFLVKTSEIPNNTSQSIN